MTNELQTTLDNILEDKNTNLKPENLKTGITCLGIQGIANLNGVMSQEEYNTCVNLTKEIIGILTTLPPVTSGLVLALDNRYNDTDLHHNNEISYWYNLVDSSLVSIPSPSFTDIGLKFNGVDFHIETPIEQSTLANGYTICLIINPEEWSNYRGVFGLHADNNVGLVGLQSKYLDIEYNNSLPLEGVSIPRDKIMTNTWHSIICVYNINECKVYVDGVIYGPAVQDGFTPYDKLVFGYSFNSYNRHFKGIMNSIFVYNRALSNDEINSVHYYLLSSIAEITQTNT